MPIPKHRQKAFDDLRVLLYRWSPPMDVTVDEPTHYELKTRFRKKGRQPMPFGAVRITKTYVSFHLKPIFVNPDLARLSPELRKRQQGKGCFNFHECSPRLFAELKELVRLGYQDFVRRGYL